MATNRPGFFCDTDCTTRPGFSAALSGILNWADRVADAVKLFIEACKAKDAWLALDESARLAFLSPVSDLMTHLERHGVEIVAWGQNDQRTPIRAPYDFFAVFKFPDDYAIDDYEHAFRSAGWYDYFEQVNFSGDVQSYASVTKALVRL